MWNMEELFELRTYIEQGRYQNALTLLGEMEEMSKDDKINKITSYLEILLLHLIKQHVEKRTTKSWNASIRNSLIHIGRTNKRRKAGGCYLSQNEIIEAMKISSGKGKSKVSPIDLAKKLGLRQRKLKKGVKPLIEASELSYWHSGSTTYIMLQKDYEDLKSIEWA